MAEIRDEKLARDAAGGDDAAFAELVRRHAPRVRALCEATLGGPAEADDAAQEAFLKAHLALPRWKADAAFGTWLYRIAVNHCLDVLRATARRRSESLEALLEGDAVALGRALEEASPAGALEARDSVERLLSRLNPEQRLALTLREAQGLSYEEIAESMSCSLDSVKARLKRARAELLEIARHFSESGDV